MNGEVVKRFRTQLQLIENEIERKHTIGISTEREKDVFEKRWNLAVTNSRVQLTFENIPNPDDTSSFKAFIKTLLEGPQKSGYESLVRKYEQKVDIAKDTIKKIINSILYRGG